jgi:hypothetical protein
VKRGLRSNLVQNIKKSLRDFPLEPEQRNAQSQEEGLEQRVHWAKDGDVLDQCAVPQELHEEGHDHHEQDEHDEVVDHLALVTGLENVKHLFIRG